jgi:hypothetical protein
MLRVIDATDIGPQTSEFTRSKILLHLCSLLGKAALACLPSVHPLHTPCYSTLNFGRPVTIKLAKDQVQHQRSKHIKLHMHFIKKLICDSSY